jgi:hypothetical protein
MKAFLERPIKIFTSLAISVASAVGLANTPRLAPIVLGVALVTQLALWEQELRTYWTMR